MEQLVGYVAPGKRDWVRRPPQGLDGLVEAGRTWNEELNAHMEGEWFTATAKDPAIYQKLLSDRRFRISRILGGRLRRDRIWKGAL